MRLLCWNNNIRSVDSCQWKSYTLVENHTAQLNLGNGITQLPPQSVDIDGKLQNIHLIKQWVSSIGGSSYDDRKNYNDSRENLQEYNTGTFESMGMNFG